ncbi:MAG TPA: hypothetical protein VF637_03345 [Sphingomicrobium sp.]
MKLRVLSIGAVFVASGSIAASAIGPTAATIERSGFATVRQVPGTPYPKAPPPSDNAPRNEAESYARDQRISIEEARKRQREQQALIGRFTVLVANLQKKEAGNFTAPRIVHQPDWGYELYFRRDPERTLAKYIEHPRFRAKLARYSREELDALIKPWAKRFSARQLAGGWGTDDTHGTAEIMMSVTADEYREIASREGWGPVPEAIKLQFASPLQVQSIDPRVAPLVRAFGQERRSTVMQLLAAGSGRITMRDGCLYFGDNLAMFHRETGIGLDGEGYLALINRSTGKASGRIGEEFTWGGPNGIAPGEPAVAELKARCGDKPVVNLGNPESSRTFRVRAWQVDDVQRRRRVSREKAWAMLRACWERQDRARETKRSEPRCNP